MSEGNGGSFFVDADSAQPDPIADDLALWMRTERGLVVVVGCCHAGLVNTLHHALKLSGETRLHAAIGGFHLNEASEVRLARTMAGLQEFGPNLIVPCHCTGERRLRGASRPSASVFSLRSPMRPNPIGVTEVDVVEVGEDGLLVAGLDAKDGSPLIDIKAVCR